MNNKLLLKNGSKIAIIGGGPGGSFFAHFASRYAKEAGIDVSVKYTTRRVSAREVHVAVICVQGLFLKTYLIAWKKRE